ncbi:sigma-54-dependent transcriptional regulator [Chitinimonas koreensis]|uniref:sigma-54-dependent transcriptional regulator n=2 Tax=Chitinimonas koreensis TaxID=356302 RepID=UPI000410E340|nr:sigma-54 dependent transcriptional regulator [Chitinimonas koreensis]
MNADRPFILLVAESAALRSMLAASLAELGYHHRTAGPGEAVRCTVEADFGLALVALGETAGADDEALLAALAERQPKLAIVAVSAAAGERHAHALGLLGLVTIPVSPAALDAMLARAGEAAATEVAGLVGLSAPLANLKRQIRRYGPLDYPVLVCGESGTGKEAAAQALHDASKRAGRPYLALNCAALSENLVEATLFGHARGAYTGAHSARGGCFEQVEDGTLFLDEIGELPPGVQAKLLRVLENGEFQRLGETQVRRSRARVVAATNRDLAQMAREGGFRADLYHRLAVLDIRTPPLRELGVDRWRLLAHFMAHYTAELGCAPFVFDAAARACWQDYAFPGNVRELRNMVIRLLAKQAGETVGAAALRAECQAAAEPAGDATPPGIDTALQTLRRTAGFRLDDWLARHERCHIEAALQLAHGNMSQAARLLGIRRTTLYSRCEQFEFRLLFDDKK